MVAAIKLKGDKALLKQLKSLEKKGLRRTMTVAAREAIKPIRRDVRKNIRTRTKKVTGNLRKGVGVKTKYFSKTGNVISVIGRKSGSKAFHWHLIELGHKLVRGGRSIGFVPGKHFLRDAMKRNKDRSTRRFSVFIRRGIKTATTSAPKHRR